MSEIVDMCRREKELTLDFQLNIDKWKSIDKDVKDIVSRKWSNIKFLNEEGNDISEEIVTVPNDIGGVYVFLLRPNIIPDMHLYIMYVGRARHKNEFSLRKRCREYISDTRPKIAYMREMWGENLYFYYLPIKDDAIVDKVEKELIRVIIPPCNTQIPDRYINTMPERPAF